MDNKKQEKMLNKAIKKTLKRRATLGQHFLTSRKVIQKIVDFAKIDTSDTVLEVGPGKGALTEEILKRGSRVIAVEKDKKLFSSLNIHFEKEVGSGQLTLIQKDIRDFSPKESGLKDMSYVLVANIPYYLSGQIFRNIVSGETQPFRAVLVVQKEVAERVVAHDSKESILSIMVKSYGTPRFIETIKRASFSPKPQVDSAILLIENISRDFFTDTDIDEVNFVSLVRKGFSQKRKKLANNIHVNPSVLKKCGFSENVRAEELSPNGWKCLCTALRQ